MPLGSAAAVGSSELGRIEAGRKADIVLLDLHEPGFAPLNDAVRQLVYSETGRAVRHVLVDGELVLENGRAARLDEAALYGELERLMPALRRDLARVRAVPDE